MEWDREFAPPSRCLEVSSSGFYAWLRRERRAGNAERLLLEIQATHRTSRGTYGSPRVHRELKAKGVQVGRHRVARLMRSAGLQGTPHRRFRVTTKSDPSLAVAPNELGRQFLVAQIDQVWAADLTYLWTAEGWLNLAVILDLCSRRVVGWALRDQLSRELPLSALTKALRARRSARLHHSDRGCQYASRQYRQALEKHGISCSMSRRGDCRDNAPVESSFATLKRELVYRSAWSTREEARADLYDYIEVFYNPHPAALSPRVPQSGGLREAASRLNQLSTIPGKSTPR